jgi:hypothetical protein
MKKQWQNKEKKDAVSFNGKGTIRSGGLWFSKGDIKSEFALIECKTTANERYSIQSSIWEKILKEALLEDKVPILSVEFGKKKHEIIVLSKSDFMDLLTLAKKL